MNLDLDTNEALVAETFGDFFAKEVGANRVRAAEPLGFDEALWHSLVAMGAPTMGVPDSLGGGGARFTELVLVAELVGRHVAPVPFVEAAVAANLLAAADASELLSSVLDGALPTLALRRPRAATCRLVPAGAVADIVVVLEDDLVALRRADGATPRPYIASPPNFGASPIADISLTDPACDRIVLASGTEARRLHATAVTEWKLLMAAALDGLRAEALRIGVDYVRDRIQFGVPIGSFQAIQQRLADVTVAGDGAHLLVYEAAWARDAEQANADELAAMAFVYMAELAFMTSREALQFHGGYGYTLEYDIQLYFRRAKTWPLALGDPRREYQDLASRLFPIDGGESTDGLHGS